MRQFEVETSDGRRLLGNLRQGADRFVVIEGSEGVVSLPMPEVTRITPIGASLWAKLDGSVDAGFSYTRSSGVAQTTFNSDTEFRRPAFSLRLTASATVTHRSDDEQGDDRSAIEFSYVRYRRRRLFVSSAGRLESNESLGLVLRSQVGGADRAAPREHEPRAVRAWWRARGEQRARGRHGAHTERRRALQPSDRHSTRTTDPEPISMRAFQYYPSLSNWGRQRLQIDFTVRRELFKDFFVALNGFDTFDSAPPNPDAARNDVGVVASIGWSY